MAKVTRRSFLKTSAAATAAVTSQTSLSKTSPAPDTREPMLYRGEHLRNVAMPLGGIGTGQIALCGDGTLRQWQIFNNVNHLAFLPGTHFLFSYYQRRKRAGVRFLQSAEFYDLPYAPVPFVTDHVIPEYLRLVPKHHIVADRITFRGRYPIAELEYEFDDLPFGIRLEALNPMIPLDVKDSSIPVILFRFTLTNLDESPARFDFWATLQNGVGYDGRSEVDEVRNSGYGGNQNQLVRLEGLTGIQMVSTALETSHPQNGSMMLTMFDREVGHVCQWQDLGEFVRTYVQSRARGKRNASDTSPRGRTYNAALVKTLQLAPGQSQSLTAAISWSFPNLVNHWGQPGRQVEDTQTQFYAGHQYSRWFPEALSAAVYVKDNLERLEGQTRTFHRAFFDSTLPVEVLSRVSSQSSLVRSPSVFMDERGDFFGFEGCHFAKPDWWGGTTGGCCPLNCTHVWQYAQTVAALYPTLEESMQETALQSQMMADGSIPHRTPYPLYLNHIPVLRIGGPPRPALDGMLGIILRTYRAVRRGAGSNWLAQLWPHLRKLVDHLFAEFDPDNLGIIEGLQPNTYDRSAYGPNTFIGSLWLAALRALEEMAKLQKDRQTEEQCRDRFERGRRAYEEVTWGEDYYIQVVDLDQHPTDNWGIGCLSDQLIGQWWSHMLGLGHILIPEHVHQATQSIMKHNFRESLPPIPYQRREFAVDGEPGLLMCSWPRGGRPETPVLYRDEIWTGVEYEVAALLIFEGSVADALRIVRGVEVRHDGRVRNPYNEIECGDHYIRAMSSWSVLEALSGFSYDHPTRRLEFGPRHFAEGRFQSFFVGGGAWGRYRQQQEGRREECQLLVDYGSLQLDSFVLRSEPAASPVSAMASLNDIQLVGSLRSEGQRRIWRFENRLSIDTGSRLTIRFDSS